MWTNRPAIVVGRVTSHLKHLKDQRAACKDEEVEERIRVF